MCSNDIPFPLKDEEDVNNMDESENQEEPYVALPFSTCWLLFFRSVRLSSFSEFSSTGSSVAPPLLTSPLPSTVSFPTSFPRLAATLHLRFSPSKKPTSYFNDSRPSNIFPGREESYTQGTAEGAAGLATLCCNRSGRGRMAVPNSNRRADGRFDAHKSESGPDD